MDRRHCVWNEGAGGRTTAATRGNDLRDRAEWRTASPCPLQLHLEAASNYNVIVRICQHRMRRWRGHWGGLINNETSRVGGQGWLMRMWENFSSAPPPALFAALENETLTNTTDNFHVPAITVTFSNTALGKCWRSAAISLVPVLNRRSYSAPSCRTDSGETVSC